MSAALALLFSAMRILITGAAGMLGHDLVGARSAPDTCSRAGSRRARHHRSRRGRVRGARGSARCRHQLRGVHERRRRRDERRAGARRQRRGRRQRRARGGRSRRVDDPRLERLRVRRRKARAVRRVRRSRAGVAVRALEARRRAGGRRRPRRTAHDRPLLVAVRRGRAVFPDDDPAAGGRARRAERRRRPGRLPDVHGHLAEALLALGAERPVGDRPRRGRGSVLVVRVRRGDRRRRGRRVRGEAVHARRILGRPAPRPAYSVLRSERAGAPAPARLARRARGVHRRAGVAVG